MLKLPVYTSKTHRSTDNRTNQLEQTCQYDDSIQSTSFTKISMWECFSKNVCESYSSSITIKGNQFQ